MVKKLFKALKIILVSLAFGLSFSCQNQVQMNPKMHGGFSYADTHKITYNNVSGLQNDNPATFYDLDSVELLPVEKDGYAFEGWYTTSNFGTDSKITGWGAFEKDSDLVLYAKFVQERFNITYSNVSGLSKPNPNPSTYNVKDNVTLQPVEKTNYVFVGWYTSSNFDPQTKITGWNAFEKQQNLTLYARFESAGIYMDRRVIIFKGTSDSPVTLIPTIVGYDNSNPVWTSLDTRVAVVQNGVVSPVNYGITTVKYEAGGGTAYVFVIVMQDYANTTYDSGTIPAETGYYTDSANVVSYSLKNGSLDFRGRLTSSSQWAMTTFSNGGWWWYVNGNSVSFRNSNNTVSVGDIDLTVIPVLAYDSSTNTSYVVIYQLLTNTSNIKLVNQKFGSSCDTKLANNDRADIVPKSYGARMYDPNTKLAFDMYCCDGPDCTPVDTLWYGVYYEGPDHLWDGTIRDTPLTNTDSGMAYAWMNIDIEPGETVLKSIRMTLVEYDPNNP